MDTTTTNLRVGPFAITAHVSDREASLAIGIQDYGEAAAQPGHGTPILVDLAPDEHPVVLVWSDLTDQEPTHRISLAGAHEPWDKVGKYGTCLHTCPHADHDCAADYCPMDSLSAQKVIGRALAQCGWDEQGLLAFLADFIEQQGKGAVEALGVFLASQKELSPRPAAQPGPAAVSPVGAEG
ncbi:MAG: hypothetical protein KKB13_08030 [Chloroflexi bacterium]|nr:hypothetical protein [Chloroflexota bacterium]